MKRCDFLRLAVAAGLAAGFLPKNRLGLAMGRPTPQPIPQRLYKNDEKLSIIGFGGILCLGLTQQEVSNFVAEVFERGINYFDVAPSYGDGEAEQKLGPALYPFREKVFLACKTTQRDADGSRKDLEVSLKRLRTDHIDLYQFHAVTTLDDVEQIFARGGALETFVKARKEGVVRYLGFSAHSEEAALAMLDRYSFDSVLFPVNVVCYAQGEFGPRVVKRAKQLGVARLALKALAYSPWPQEGSHPYAKCWYRPIDDHELAKQALRFTLSEDVTAAVPPGEESLFRIAMEAAGNFTPLTQDEREELIRKTAGIPPLFKS